MQLLELKSNEFETDVLSSPVPVLVDFWSPSCGPCRVMEPVIDALAQEGEGQYRVKKVNVWDQPELATRFAIAAVPTLLIFNHGEVVWSALGVQNKQRLHKALEEAE
jgi:thioredoxin 1